MKSALPVGILAAFALAFSVDQGAAQTGDPIRIGAYNAVTGPIPLTGRQIQNGWRTAVNAANEAGGINGRMIELLVEDDQYEPSRAVAAARKLVGRDGVLLMTGLGTPTSVVVAKYLDAEGVPLLFPMGASSTQLNNAGFDGLFMLHPAYITQAEIINAWMLDNAEVTQPCIIHQLDPSGEDHLAGYRNVVEARGIKPVAEPIERGTTDFGGQVLKLRNAGCDMIYTATVLEAAARIVTAADRIGWHPKFAGFTTQADSALISLLGPLAEGFYAANMMLSVDEDTPVVEAYLADLKKHFPDQEPTFFTNYGYASMMAIIEALKEAAGGDPTREAVTAAIASWTDKEVGMFGPVSFGPDNHDGKRSLYMIQVRDGKWERVSDWYGEDAAN